MDAEALGRTIGFILGGAVFGLIPFYVGKKKGRKRLGITGLVVSALSASFLMPTLVLPIALVFAGVIWVFPEGQVEEAEFEETDLQ